MSSSSSFTPPSAPENPLLASLRSLPREPRNLLAGGLAGMLAKTVVAPIDRIKILYQVTSARFRLGDVPRVARSIVEKEGWAALWKGNAATMMRVFPYSGIQFMVFDHCKVRFLGEKRKRKLGGGGASARPGNGPGGAHNLTRTISHRGTITNKGVPPGHGGGAGDRKAGLTPAESLISGMVAGTVSVLCTYPLDLARAQLAVLRKKKKPKTSAEKQLLGINGAVPPPANSKKGIGYVLSKSFQRAGAPGLYRGIAPTILGILPYSGVAFTINEQAKRRITQITKREPTTVERLQCGALSGLFAQTLAYPLEVTRRRMQTIGIVPTSGRESAAVNFTGVSRLTPSADELPERAEQRQQQQQQQQQRQSQQSTGRTAPRLNVAGNASGSTASVEGVGERIMNGSGNIAAAQQQQHHRHSNPPSMTNTMRHLFEEQGLRGFYKGVSMNWVKGPIAFSISFTAFDTLQGWLRSDEERRERRRNESKGFIRRRLTNNEDGD